MYPSFEDILPNGVFVGFSDGKGDFELDIELPDTVIPGHQDLVEEDDHVLPAFLEENELDNDFIYWGDINQLPLSLLRYEIILAAQKSAEALSASGIQFRTAPEICIGDGDEDTGDAQEYLQKIKDELKKKVPKKDKRLREAMAALFYNSDEKQKWFISL